MFFMLTFWEASLGRDSLGFTFLHSKLLFTEENRSLKFDRIIKREPADLAVSVCQVFFYCVAYCYPVASGCSLQVSVQVSRQLSTYATTKFLAEEAAASMCGSVAGTERCTHWACYIASK